MVKINLPDAFDEEFLKKVPQHISHINKLVKNNTISSYSVSEARDMVWIVLNAKTEHEAKQILFKIPLIDQVAFRIHELILHQRSSNIQIPTFSLN